MAKSAQLARLEKRLAAIPKAVKEAVQPALEKSGNELVGTMQALAESSRLTGKLIDSIHSEPGDHELQRKVVAGDKGAFYARWVEFGTSRTPAQPFFFVAYRLLRKRMATRIKRAIGKAVRDGWAK
jgi:HK97 gp10 family phage protein